MTLHDRVRARFALALHWRQPAGDCPTPEDILAWHEKSLSDGPARQVKNHVSHCDHCFALWSGLVALDTDPQEQANPSFFALLADSLSFGRRKDTERRSHARTSWPRGWAAVPALAVGVVAVSVWMAAPDVSPIPRYELGIRSELDYRGAGTEDVVLALRDGAFLEVLLTPHTAASDTMEVRVYARIAGELVAIDAGETVTAKGVASLEGIVGSDILIPDGSTHLYIVVGRRGQLPAAGQLLRALANTETSRTENWSAWALTLDSTR